MLRPVGDWAERYRDGEARLPEDPDERQRQLTRMGNCAWAAGLSALLAGDREDFPADVADALAAIAAHDRVAYVEAVESVLESFETRETYLEDLPVADTVIVLQALAARRRIEAELPPSELLPHL